MGGNSSWKGGLFLGAMGLLGFSEWNIWGKRGHLGLRKWGYKDAELGEAQLDRLAAGTQCW